MKTVLVTGSSGLVGSVCVRHFYGQGWAVHGLDGNQRRDFFGPDGDTRLNCDRLQRDCPAVHLWTADIRDAYAVAGIVRRASPDVVIHAAAQPSHDYATLHPETDFHTNAVGTLNVLEAVRNHSPEAVFIFCSTNKVYGDAPNEKAFVEQPTRWEFVDREMRRSWRGFDETLRIDQSRHSLFGASKLAADILTQEYARTFGMKTGVFRMGCITGAAHAGAEQHGFLSYLVRCVREGRPYKVYGYKGKQVRDNLHAADVASAFALFAANPKPGEVYNLGGGRENSVSILEAIAKAEALTGRKLDWSYVDEPRGGDHIVYISDCSKFKYDCPDWRVTKSLDEIFSELLLTA